MSTYDQLWIVNYFLEGTYPASYHFSCSDCFFAQRKVVLSYQVKWVIDKILSKKFKPYQVKHVEDQKQVVEGFVNSLEMQKEISIVNFGWSLPPVLREQ